MKKLIILSLLVILLTLPIIVVETRQKKLLTGSPSPISKFVLLPTPSPTPYPLKTLPVSKTLSNPYHVFQTFNNCGPAALSMTLSYYNIEVSQTELGQALRPYQIANGDNDDKSVTLAELAEKAQEYNLIPFHRPLGSEHIVKHFINYDIPIITRTYLNEREDIGHYRIIKGFDDTTREFIQDDSLQGRNLRYSYSAFNNLWEQFNFEFMVLVPADKLEVAHAILGENSNRATAWKNASISARNQLATDPDNINTRFNLSVALHNSKEFKESTKEFEKIETRLSPRTLWYQIEPIQSYYEIGNYPKVFEMTDKILNNHNRAFSELYVLRGKIYQKQGQFDLAKEEFEKAVLYNKNLREAQELLAQI